MPDEISTGELSRRLDAFERHINTEFAKLGRSIDSLRFVHVETYRAERDADRHRIESVETDVAEIREDRKWQQRMIVGAVVTSVVLPLLLKAFEFGALGGGG